MNSPLISVVLPVYNGEDYLNLSLSSVLNQSYPKFEILIIDDGSTDRTKEIAEKYKRSNSNVEVITIENQGLANARNVGIKHSSGKYVAFIDHDDIWLKDKLSHQYDLISKNEDIGLVSCVSAIIDSKNNLIAWKMGKILIGDVFCEMQYSNWVINGSAPLLRKECFEDVGYFKKEVSLCEDWDMWLRIAEKYKFETVDETLVCYRKTGRELTADINQNYRKVKSFIQDYELDTKTNSGSSYNLAMCSFSFALLHGDYKSSWKYLFKGISKNFALTFSKRKNYLLIPLLLLLTIFPIEKLRVLLLRKVVLLSMTADERNDIESYLINIVNPKSN